MSAALTAYRLGLGAAEPFAPLLLRRRARRGKEDPARLGERLGRASAPRPPGPVLWLHGASVGESLSLLPLVTALQRARPEATLLVTSGTTTSAELLARRLPAEAIHQYAPVDAPRAARRFLDHWRPELAVFVESELWPNLLLGAKSGGARLALLSARLSDASVGGWTRAPGGAGRLLGAFDLVMAQDDETAARLTRLGARDDGRLNLKLVGEPLPYDARALRALQHQARGRPVLLAASTHPGEETMALNAFAPLMMRDALLVVAPRHPSRGSEVADLVRAQGWPVARQGAGDSFGGERVYVADALGELGLWFRIARAALVGGGVAEGVGGHNPLEPARLGCPFVSGSKVDNWRGVYDALEAVGGVSWADDAYALNDFWARAVYGDTRPRTQAERALAYAQSQSGALEAATERLLELLP